MDYSEALSWCEKFIDNLVSSNVDTKKRTRGLQAMQVCKSALEKQIPKKPLDISKLYNGDYGHCPCCNRVVSDYKEMKVCSDCGQALDWSDTK